MKGKYIQTNHSLHIIIKLSLIVWWSRTSSYYLAPENVRLPFVQQVHQCVMTHLCGKYATSSDCLDCNNNSVLNEQSKSTYLLLLALTYVVHTLLSLLGSCDGKHTEKYLCILHLTSDALPQLWSQSYTSMTCGSSSNCIKTKKVKTFVKIKYRRIEYQQRCLLFHTKRRGSAKNTFSTAEQL